MIKMVKLHLGRGAKHAEVQTAQAEAPEFEKVTWWKDPGLRQLYLWCAVLMTVSIQTGYDACVVSAARFP